MTRTSPLARLWRASRRFSPLPRRRLPWRPPPRRPGAGDLDPREEAPSGPAEAALAVPAWMAHMDRCLDTGVVEMARRLPALAAQALRLAWRASRVDTAATVSMNLAAGAFTTFGLLATTGVLQALFASSPTPQRVRAALPSLLMVSGAAMLRTGLQAGAGWAQARLRPQVDRIVEMRLFELTTRVELAALDDADFHDAMERARDRGLFSATRVVQEMIDVLTGAVGLAAAAGTLGVLHPLLLPLLLATAVPEGWASVRSARLRYVTMFSLIRARRRKWILSDLMADRQPAAEVRSFTMRHFLLGEYDALASAQRDIELGLARRQSYARIVGAALGGVATAAVYVTLGLLLWAGAVPLAVAGTAVLAIRTGKSSLANLVFATNGCYEEGLYFGDYLEFCSAAERRSPPKRTRPAPRAFERVVADDITFTYPGAEAPSLRGVSVELRRGEVVALVGENGSGKTTLAKILAGLYEPDEGEIRWDDVPVREVDADRLRERIAVIAQDYTHWPMSARDNITMGRSGGADLLRRAARACGADEVVAELPHGYDTLLDRRFDGGAELSGGQWQRLAAARGFYRDAPLLICDEPTAALDARAEHALFARIRAHAEGRTVLLITHRLASVRRADRTYVLDGGRVAEQGCHEELMSAGGLYAELYSLQASAYRTSGDLTA